MVYTISSLYLNKTLKQDFIFINTNTFSFVQLGDILQQHYVGGWVMTCVLFKQKETDQMYLVNQED